MVQGESEKFQGGSCPSAPLVSVPMAMCIVHMGIGSGGPCHPPPPGFTWYRYIS